VSVRRWEELTREELAELAPRAVCVLPVASIEQHGPHLPTVTDTALVSAVVDRACSLLPEGVEVVRAPVQCYGASDHHLPFGGTLSLTTATLRAVLGDLVRSAARAGCGRVLIVNGHGGNASTCATVAGDLSREEGILVAACSYWELVELPDGSSITAGHAGEFESSLMLVARPELVHLDRARPSPGEVPRYRRGLNVRPSDSWQRIDGFTDDPRRSTVELGETMLSRCGEALAGAIADVATA
jgi:creatinine amidohydrolase